MPYKPRLRYVDLPLRWDQFQREKTYANMGGARAGFKRQLKKEVREMDVEVVDSYVKFCLDCNVPGMANNMYVDYNARGRICADCTRYYRFCDQCNRHYSTRNGRDHTHSRRSCCSSPEKRFTIRDGDGALANDVRTTISLPSGEISEQGISDIQSVLRGVARTTYYAEWNNNDDMYSGHNRGVTERYNLTLNGVARMPELLGSAVQTKRGNYTKRLNSLFYKDFGTKISPAVISQIGNIASDHSKGSTYHVEMTRELNKPAGEFAHNGSCWWSSYSNSRCTFKTNGGFGMRTFNREQGSGVSGRAWVMPLKVSERFSTTTRVALTPTFETLAPAAYVVFNGYGSLTGYTPARLLSQMTGMTYRKIDFSASPMYINAGGYVVAPEELAQQFTDGGLTLSLSQHATLHNTEMVEARQSLVVAKKEYAHA